MLIKFVGPTINYYIKDVETAVRFYIEHFKFVETFRTRFVTVRRGGALQNSDHHLLAVWAADCAQHMLHLFEQMQPCDDRPRRAIEQARLGAG